MYLGILVATNEYVIINEKKMKEKGGRKFVQVIRRNGNDFHVPNPVNCTYMIPYVQVIFIDEINVTNEGCIYNT